jgi:hypothetical protein
VSDFHSDHRITRSPDFSDHGKVFNFPDPDYSTQSADPRHSPHLIAIIPIWRRLQRFPDPSLASRFGLRLSISAIFGSRGNFGSPEGPPPVIHRTPSQSSQFGVEFSVFLTRDDPRSFAVSLNGSPKISGISAYQR